MPRPKPPRASTRTSRGTAALEFALVCPVLLLIFGGLSDYALLIWTKNRLADGVAQAAQYAFITGLEVTTADITSVVQNAASLPSASVSVMACYCGAPDSSPAPNPCTPPCPDQNTPGTYLAISATDQYQPLMPTLSEMSSPEISESAFVRLQ